MELDPGRETGMLDRRDIQNSVVSSDRLCY